MGTPEQDVVVKINSDAGTIRFFVQKVVVDAVTNHDCEISLEDARRIRPEAQVDDTVSLECTAKNIGRIAAQTARQVVLQRLREAEHRAIFEEFTTREGEVVTGVVQFLDPKGIYLRLNRTEALLPPHEQIPTEHYYRGQRLKLYLLEMSQDTRGPQIIVSRSHPHLVRRLFEMEIPEVHSGVVEVRAIAREAGHRTKVAVGSTQKSIEPVGCCLGPRGIRLQSIIKELNREKIDVIQWDEDPGLFITNALGPAQVANIRVHDTNKVAHVVVPDKQLSLAIGKEGQNARLAAKLTGWRIDIKSVSAAEAERAAAQQLEAAAAELAAAESTVVEPVETPLPEQELPAPEPAEAEAIIEEPVEIEAEELEEETAEEEEGTEVLTAAAPPPEPLITGPQIRFAEDILSRPARGARAGGARAKTKAKSTKRRKAPTYVEDDSSD